MVTLATRLSLSYVPKSAMHVPEIKNKAKVSHKITIQERGTEIQELKRQSMMKRYGVPHQIHLPEIRKKVFQTYKIVLAGVTYTYQGYEGHLLRYLHARGFKISTQTQGISYRKQIGSFHQYYPDIKAMRGDTKYLIEVKSSYTFRWTRDTCPEKLFAGTKWAEDKGADFLVVIIFPKKEKMIIFKNPKTTQDLNKPKGKLMPISVIDH